MQGAKLKKRGEELTIGVRPMCEYDIDIIELEPLERFLCAFDDTARFKKVNLSSTRIGI
jgi:hypothetical protein